MTIDVRTISYQADGLELVGTLATPRGAGKRPGVLIGHEGLASMMFNATAQGSTPSLSSRAK